MEDDSVPDRVRKKRRQAVVPEQDDLERIAISAIDVKKKSGKKAEATPLPDEPPTPEVLPIDAVKSDFAVWVALGGSWAELQPVKVPGSASGWYLHDLKSYLLAKAISNWGSVKHGSEPCDRDLPVVFKQFLLAESLSQEMCWLEPHQMRFSLMDGRRIPANRRLRDVLSVTQDLVLQRIDGNSVVDCASGSLQLPSEPVEPLSTVVAAFPVPSPFAPALQPQLASPIVAQFAEIPVDKPVAVSPASSVTGDPAVAIMNRLVDLEDKIDAKNAYFETAVKELRLLTASVRAAGGVAAMPGRSPGQVQQLDAAVPSRQPKGSLENEHAGSVWALATNKEQTRLASGSSDTGIVGTPPLGVPFIKIDALMGVVWDLQTLKPLQKLKGHTSIVHSLDMHGDNIISGSDDRTVRLWSAKDQYACTKIVRSNDIPSCLKVANNLLFQGTYKSVRVFNLEPELSLLKAIDAYVEDVRCFVITIVVGTITGCAQYVFRMRIFSPGHTARLSNTTWPPGRRKRR